MQSWKDKTAYILLRNTIRHKRGITQTEGKQDKRSTKESEQQAGYKKADMDIKRKF
jgi:hypothetical protein